MASRIVLRSPALSDQREFLAAVARSSALHRPWVAPPAAAAAFRAYVDRMAQPANCAWLVCERESGRIAGVINITNIVLGPLRSGYTGYYAFAGFERRGLMREGLTAAVRHAFTKLRLHRVEANIQPGNAASIALARACGFSQEGFSPRYLKIGGRWRDHERWARVAD
ncbi:MAG TPA: GNAT family protein [Burkholderiaceae bacterium]|jgi:ribosomal-protein-alanine N-acetyltransferase|nr:GNAT family protein [Burkholderiaceae bacterium]